ncbi:FeoB-associated Cys-rich membrane protein [uncultured Flavobacterium sp.]|nr:FeoB-associated Cys-rich membrane protein [uncultured Flavobacterium sp.]
MDLQTVIMYVLVAGAFAFLVKKFFFKKKKKSGDCGNGDCRCS